MNISQDLKSHFSKFKKYITPDGIVFYDKKDYDIYMNTIFTSQKIVENDEFETQV